MAQDTFDWGSLSPLDCLPEDAELGLLITGAQERLQQYTSGQAIAEAEGHVAGRNDLNAFLCALGQQSSSESLQQLQHLSAMDASQRDSASSRYAAPPQQQRSSSQELPAEGCASAAGEGLTAEDVLKQEPDKDVQLTTEPQQSRAEPVTTRSKAQQRRDLREQKAEATRRQRAKQKERQSAHFRKVEAELQAAREELSRMRLDQQQLQTKCNILEQLTRTATQNNHSKEVEEMRLLALETKALHVSSVMVLSVDEGAPLLLTLDELRSMSFEGFCKIWRSYINQMAARLINERTAAAHARLAGLVGELMMLCGAMGSCNAVVLRKLHAYNLERPHEAKQVPQKAFWENVLRHSNFGEEQAADFMALRAAYLLRCGQIRRHRHRALVDLQSVLASGAEVPLGQGASTTQGHDFVTASKALQSLQDSVRKEHSSFTTFMTACSLGVATVMQNAHSFVQSYPLAPDSMAVLNLMAEERGEQHANFLLSWPLHDSIVDAQWDKLVTYAESLTPADMHSYVSYTDFGTQQA